MEVQFGLEQVVLTVVVRAAVCAVDLIVGAHHVCCSGADCLSKCPHVELMRSLVINVAVNGVVARLDIAQVDAAIGLLFVANPVYKGGRASGCDLTALAKETEARTLGAGSNT